MATTTITLSQLEEHSTQQDLWVAVHGKVYDLTSFATDHPGGIDALKEVAGTDASEAYEYAGHSDTAIKTMEQFFVGSLAGYTADPAQTKNESAAKASSGNKGTVSLRRVTATVAFDKLIRPALSLVGLVAFAVLYRSVGGEGGREVSDVASAPQLVASVNPAYSFLGGLFLASSLGCAGWAFIYSQFTKTLDQEKDVFSYPPVIPRRRAAAKK